MWVGDGTAYEDDIGLSGTVSGYFETEASDVVSGGTYSHEFDATAAGSEGQRPQGVAAAPIDKLVERTHHDVHAAGVQFLNDFLECFVVLKFFVRDGLDDGFLRYFHSSAPFRQA